MTTPNHPIDSARVARQLKWADLCTKAKIRPNRLWQIRRGFSQATAVERTRLARVLKVAPEALGL